MELESALEARGLLERAVALDPNYDEALALILFSYFAEVSRAGGVSDMATLRGDVQASVDRLLAIGQHSALALVVLGATRVFYRRGDEPTAIRQLRAGLARNPNLAMGWGFLGVSLCYLGETSEGLAALERASLLNPYDPLLFLWKQGEAVGHFTAARYEQAIASAGEAVSLHPNWSLSYRYLAAAFAHLGRLDEAVAALQTSLKLDPNYTITIARDVTPLHEEALERLIDGLRKASLQE